MSDKLIEAFTCCASSEIACNLFEHCGLKVQLWERLWASRFEDENVKNMIRQWKSGEGF